MILLEQRWGRIANHPFVVEKRLPNPCTWPFEFQEPEAIAQFYQLADGIVLSDETIVLPKSGLKKTTEWLKDEKSLDWPDDLIVIGERCEVVVLFDADTSGLRSGGGVLEVSTDNLIGFERVAWTILSYLEERLQLSVAARSPEKRAVVATRDSDRQTLEEVIYQPVYPGMESKMAHAARILGGMYCVDKLQEQAMVAFEQSVKLSRQASSSMGRESWIRCAQVAREMGSEEVAVKCLQRNTP